MKKELLISLLLVVVLSLVAVSQVLANGGVEVQVDIKPGSDPNALNVWSKGKLPVAILGSADFDAMAVDPETVYLTWDGITLPAGINGAMPIRWAWEDVNRDGFTDIILKFSKEELAHYTDTKEAHGADVTLEIIGYTFEGSLIGGADVVRIINKNHGGS